MYVPLHVHTDASLKDGLGPLHHLVEEAKNKGFKALAMTDHGTLANAIAFTSECELAGIKPIIGLEAYVYFNGDSKGHLTLLADGDIGLSTLIYLNNFTHKNTVFGFPIDLLAEQNKGIVCLSGCQASPLQTLPLKEAIRLGARLKTIFKNRFIIEAMSVNDYPHAKRAKELSKALGVPIVITNDSHFALKDEADIHPILTNIKAHFKYESKELYLKDQKELFVKFTVDEGWEPDEAKKAIEMSGRIAERIGQYHIKKAPKLPEIKDSDMVLVRTTNEMFASNDTIPKDFKYKLRIEYELGVITRMGYSTYFLILKDIIDFAKAHDIKVGPGRGSGAGSLVLYILGITQIDPIYFDLPFERFLHEKRVGMPDVDIDLDSERRQEVLDYAIKRWHAVPIATYSRYNHKSLVHDLAKELEIPREEELPAAEMGDASAPFKQLCEHNPTFSKCYHTMIGQIRHKGKHAGGIIITNVEMPIEKVGDHLAAAWTEGRLNELSKAGIVKYDFLGLSALAILKRLESNLLIESPSYLEATGGPEFSLFSSGKMAGIFQFSGSPGIIDYTKRFNPKNLNDLILINALYRPGALDVGATEKFLEWRENPREVPEVIADILAPTYGAIIYQEQVMQIFAKIMGGTMADADEARRMIIKSKFKDEAWVKEFETFKSKFLAEALKKMSKEEAYTLFEEISAHVRYSFNKAHAAAYAYISWQLAWYKYYFPTHFYATLIDVDPFEMQEYIFAAVSDGIKVRAPHINAPNLHCSIVETENEIILPITCVKYLSTTAAHAIGTAILNHGKFTKLADVIARVPKKAFRSNARAGLAAIGGMHGLETHEPWKELDIPPLPPTTIREAEMEFLGLVIPTSYDINKLNELKAKYPKKLFGIIKKAVKKTSKYGEYHVYHLFPEGVCWKRGGPVFKEGQTIMATVEKGKAVAMEAILL